MWAARAKITMSATMKKIDIVPILLDRSPKRKAFTHSTIGKARRLEDYVAPTEPALPATGTELTCPHCGAKNIYFLTDLKYVPSSRGNRPKGLLN